MTLISFDLKGLSYCLAWTQFLLVQFRGEVVISRDRLAFYWLCSYSFLLLSLAN